MDKESRMQLDDMTIFFLLDIVLMQLKERDPFLALFYRRWPHCNLYTCADSSRCPSRVDDVTHMNKTRASIGPYTTSSLTTDHWLHTTDHFYPPLDTFLTTCPVKRVEKGWKGLTYCVYVLIKNKEKTRTDRHRNRKQRLSFRTDWEFLPLAYDSSSGPTNQKNK